MKDPQPISTALRSARRVVVLTGAGVSAESGISTFRNAMTGLWEQYDAQAMATAEAFRRDPELVWGGTNGGERRFFAPNPIRVTGPSRHWSKWCPKSRS